MNRTKSIYLALLAVLLSPMAANAALIEIYYADGGIGNIAQAESWIDGTPNETYDVPAICLTDNYNGGSCPTNRTQTVSNNYWVASISGLIDTTLYSQLFFLHDDGISVQIGGDEYFEYNANTAPRWSTGGAFADTGMQALDILFWENGGGAILRVEAIVRGSHERGLARVGTPVPEPGTLALLGLGLVGMAARRRKTV